MAQVAHPLDTETHLDPGPASPLDHGPEASASRRASLAADPDLGRLSDQLLAARHRVCVKTVQRVRRELRIVSPYRRAIAANRLVQAFVDTLTPPPPTASCLHWHPDDE